MKVTIVIPSNRDLQSLNDWAGSDLDRYHIILVEDNPKATIKLPSEFDITHYSHEDIDKDLREDSWIISRGDSAIKSYGLLKAYQEGADVVVCLDDDVVSQQPDFIQTYANLLSARTRSPHRNRLKLFGVMGIPDVPQKGLPTKVETESEIAFVYGLWHGYADVHAKYIEEVGMPSYNNPNPPVGISTKDFLAVSGMNVGMKREMVPAYYQWLMGKEYRIGKWGDTWSGLCMQKILYHLNKSMIFGPPSVFHQHFGDSKGALEVEKLGYQLNDYLWDSIQDIELTEKSVRRCYVELAQKLKAPDSWAPQEANYLEKQKQAMLTWANYF